MHDLRSLLRMLDVDQQPPDDCSAIVRSNKWARSARDHALSRPARLNRRLRTASKQHFAFPFRTIDDGSCAGISTGMLDLRPRSRMSGVDLQAPE